MFEVTSNRILWIGTFIVVLQMGLLAYGAWARELWLIGLNLGCLGVTVFNLMKYQEHVGWLRGWGDAHEHILFMRSEFMTSQEGPKA